MGIQINKVVLMVIMNTTLLVWGACPAYAAQGASELIVPEYIIKLKNKDAGPITVNNHLTLVATLVPQRANAPAVKGFKFDARMPAHQHGMVTKAKVKKIANNSYEISGVRFHMSGAWELKFILNYAVGETVVTQSLGFE